MAKWALPCYNAEQTREPTEQPCRLNYNPSQQKSNQLRLSFYWIQLDVNACNSSYLYNDSGTLHLLTAITFLYGLFSCVIGVSLKVWDGFQLYYFKLFITVFIREWLSPHYVIGLCKAGNNWLLGCECMCVRVSVHSVKWQRLFLSLALSLFGRVCVLFGEREKPWRVNSASRVRKSHILPSTLISDFINICHF